MIRFVDIGTVSDESVYRESIALVCSPHEWSVTLNIRSIDLNVLLKDIEDGHDNA